jgi:hypothetical protein
LGIVFGLPGFILGFIALNQITKAGVGPDGRDIESGRGLAIASIIVPIVLTILALFLFVLNVVLNPELIQG